MDARLRISPSETRSGIEKHLDRLGIPWVHDQGIEETFGADYLVETTTGTLAIQRKAIGDLISSLTASDTLGREISKLRFADIPWLVVEGNWEETDRVLQARDFSQGALRKLLTSVRREGVWVQHTTCVGDTALWIAEQIEYWNNERHDSLLMRPRQPASVRAADQQRERALEVLMSFAGVGRRRAEAIYDEFRGVPLAWMCSVEQLAALPRIGEVTAQRLMEQLDS